MGEFEVFSKALVPLKREPTLTIQKNGVISLNKAALMTIGAPEAVELLFDPGSRTVGLRGVDPEAENACAVRCIAGPGAGTFVISAMAFLHFYDIVRSVSRRWRAYLDGDILCIDLEGESVVVTSNRAKRAHTTGRR